MSSLRRREVVAERLLDDEARPAAVVLPLAERVDDRRERRRRDGEVVDAVAAEVVLGVELVDEREELVLAALVGEVGRDPVELRGELVPDLLVERVARVLLHGGLHVRAVLRRRVPSVRATPTIAKRSGRSRRTASA